jgi:hypothetical protein
LGPNCGTGELIEFDIYIESLSSDNDGDDNDGLEIALCNKDATTAAVCLMVYGDGPQLGYYDGTTHHKLQAVTLGEWHTIGVKITSTTKFALYLDDEEVTGGSDCDYVPAAATDLHEFRVTLDSTHTGDVYVDNLRQRTWVATEPDMEANDETEAFNTTGFGTSARDSMVTGAVASVTAPVSTTKDTVIDAIAEDAAAAKTAAEAGKLVTDKVDTMLQASGDNYQLTTDALENAPTGVTNYTIGSATTGEVGGMNLTAYQNKRFRDFTTGLPFAIPGASALTGKSLAFVVSKVKGAALWSLTSASSQITVGGTGDKYAYVSDDDTHTGTAGKYEWSLHNLTDDDLVNRGYLDIERCVEMPST